MKFPFYYLTSFGNIVGALTITESMLMFDPSLTNM